MRFSDLLPGFQKKQVGRVLRADWDSAEHGIRFTLVFEPSNRTLEGIVNSGADPTTGVFITESELRSKLRQVQDLKIFEHPTSGDPNTFSNEDFRSMKIEFSLSNLSLGYRATAPPVTANTFLSRILR
jgi:hypothetical protein